ncbi:MAG: DUF2269 family protein [Gemmatimonadales bacterium]
MSEVVLFLHVLGVLLFVSGIVVAGVAFESARGRKRPEEMVLLLSLTRFGVALVAFGGMVLFVCGFWLAGLEGIGLGTGWLAAAIVLFVLALALGGLGGQRPKRARLLATELAERGEGVSAELRSLLEDRASRWANQASAALIVVVLALMVFKP